MPKKKPSPAVLRLIVRIKELRRAAGQTQEHVAEKAGIAYKYYQEIEGGRAALRLSTLEKLAAHYGLELDDLFIQTTPSAPLSSRTGRRQIPVAASKRAKTK